MAPTPSDDVSSPLSSLSITTHDLSKPSSSKPKKKPVADSWDEEASSSSDTETESTSKPPSNRDRVLSNPQAPPPTPASPTPHSSFAIDSSHPFANLPTSDSRREGNRTPERRPDKTTSAATRMIAAGLGVRAPKRTEEERAYERAMKEKQAKLREEKKKEEEEREKARAAVWED